MDSIPPQIAEVLNPLNAWVGSSVFILNARYACHAPINTVIIIGINPRLVSLKDIIRARRQKIEDNLKSS